MVARMTTANGQDENESNVRVAMRRRSTLYLRMVKFLEDHHVLGPLLLLLPILIGSGGVGWLIGGSRAPSLTYASQAFRTAYLDVFGGAQKLKDATDINNDLMRFSNGYDSYDVAATSLFILATSSNLEMFETILKQPNGRVRIMVLDPRIALEEDKKSEFIALSHQFGDSPEQTFTECLVSTYALAKINDAFSKVYGQRFQVRFYRSQYPNAAKFGHYLLGRSYQKYSLNNPNHRFDIIVPYNNPSEVGKDSPHRGAWRIKDSAQNDLVKQYREEFEIEWNAGIPLDEVLRSLPSPLDVANKRNKGQ
jgi:hypothetical protein